MMIVDLSYAFEIVQSTNKQIEISPTFNQRENINTSFPIKIVKLICLYHIINLFFMAFREMTT
jgi:hypothetical protein